MGRYAQAQKRGRDLALGSGPSRPAAPQGEDWDYDVSGDVTLRCGSRPAGLLYFQGRAVRTGDSTYTLGNVAAIVGGESLIPIGLDSGQHALLSGRWGPTAVVDLSWSLWGGNTEIISE